MPSTPRASLPIAPAQHKGLFGMKGTLRDILGIVGDTLMMNSGIDPVFMPTRRGEAVSDAMGSYGTNPLGAVQQVSAIDPKLGQQYLEQYQKEITSKRALDYQRSKDLKEQDNADRRFAFDVGKEDYDRYQKVAPGLYGMIAGANEKTYPGIRQKALAISSKYGQPLPIDLPERYDNGVASSYKNLAVSPTAQAQLEATNARSAASLNLGYENLRVREGTANKPKEVDSYTGDDGFRYTTWDNGTTTKSATKAKPSGSGRQGASSASSSTPPPPRKVGDRIKGPNGQILTSKDGKTWSN